MNFAGDECVESPLADYEKRYSLKSAPADFLTGDLDKREAVLTLHGKKSDDLNGTVKLKLLHDLNGYFWEHPRDADDTRLVFEATEKEAKYEEKKDGVAVLKLKIEIGLASHKPEDCCCC